MERFRPNRLLYRRISAQADIELANAISKLVLIPVDVMPDQLSDMVSTLLGDGV